MVAASDERRGLRLEGERNVGWEKENGGAEVLKGVGESVDLRLLDVNEEENACVALNGSGEQIDGVFERGWVDLRFIQEENR